MKTSLLKWRPDYDSAADEYAKAAMFYRNAKSYENCVDSLIKASECYKQNRSLFHAAKSIDQAVLVYKDMNNLGGIRKLAEKAAHLFQQVIKLAYKAQLVRALYKKCLRTTISRSTVSF